MIISPDYKIERSSKQNVSLYKRRNKGKSAGTWYPVKHFRSFQEAIIDSITLVTIDQIQGEGSVQDVIDEIMDCKELIMSIARGFGHQFDRIAEEVRTQLRKSIEGNL